MIRVVSVGECGVRAAGCAALLLIGVSLLPASGLGAPVPQRLINTWRMWGPDRGRGKDRPLRRDVRHDNDIFRAPVIPA